MRITFEQSPDPSSLDELALGDVMDGPTAQLEEGFAVMRAMRNLFTLTRHMSYGAAWPRVRARLREQPIAALVRQDPFTDWSFRRPRGYPGDATLIDFIYGHGAVGEAMAAASGLGHEVHAYTFGSSACVAVRERRRLLALAIDAAVRRVGRPEVMAVACGHLREIELCLHASRAKRIVALDQDERSLREVTARYGGRGNIECVQSKVARLMLRPQSHGRFDLIYAAGLYDYLSAEHAAQLTSALFSALKPGGRLLIGNFAKGIPEVGYMDAFMDWRLILREEEEMEAMLGGLPEGAARHEIFRGNNGGIIYAQVERLSDA